MHRTHCSDVNALFMHLSKSLCTTAETVISSGVELQLLM
jgi:hypothetical protein